MLNVITWKLTGKPGLGFDYGSRSDCTCAETQLQVGFDIALLRIWKWEGVEQGYHYTSQAAAFASGLAGHACKRLSWLGSLPAHAP